MNRRFLIVCMAVGLGGIAFAVPRSWAPEIKSSDTEFWKQSKAGVDLRMATAKDDVQDLVSNVRAWQEMDGVCSKNVIIRYDLWHPAAAVNISAVVKDGGEVVPATTFSGDIGPRITPGLNKKIVWNAGVDYDNHLSSNMVVSVIGVLVDNPSTWAVVTIEWAAFGGRDLDVCGYWLDRPDVKVGWSYSTGSTSSTYRSTWRGDNTGSGPEYINIGVVPGEVLSGVMRRIYRIHCNYFGEPGSAAKATISVLCNGKTLAKTISTGTNRQKKAETSDPYVTITFDTDGNLVSVD